MSIRNRVEESAALALLGRGEGAWLSMMVATSATSRKRYPAKKFGPGEAFKRFVGDEMLVLTYGSVLNFNNGFRGQMFPLQEIIWTWVRNELEHDAALPVDLELTASGENLAVRTSDDRLVLRGPWLAQMDKVIRFAPENADEFPSEHSQPPDWYLQVAFGMRAASPQVLQYVSSREARLADYWARCGQSVPIASDAK